MRFRNQLGSKPGAPCESGHPESQWVGRHPKASAGFTWSARSAFPQSPRRTALRRIYDERLRAENISFGNGVVRLPRSRCGWQGTPFLPREHQHPACAGAIVLFPEEFYLRAYARGIDGILVSCVRIRLSHTKVRPASYPAALIGWCRK